MRALAVEGLTKAYPRFTLDKVSLTLEQGRIMGLIGKNGAGKSTLLKSLLHLVSPDAGTITLLGRPFPEGELESRQELGVVLGGIDFYRHKRLDAITAVTRRFYRRWDEKACRRYMEAFELDGRKRVGELSAGMRVKYLIALALSHGARLFLFDEPTSGLDPVSRDELLELFRALTAGGERSILFSTHITSDLDRCADDVAYLRGGRLLACGGKAEFIRSFRHLRTPEDRDELSLEEIMVRAERRSVHV